jgi:hypothetical protein
MLFVVLLENKYRELNDASILCSFYPQIPTIHDVSTSCFVRKSLHEPYGEFPFTESRTPNKDEFSAKDNANLAWVFLCGYIVQLTAQKYAKEKKIVHSECRRNSRRKTRRGSTRYGVGMGCMCVGWYFTWLECYLGSLW